VFGDYAANTPSSTFAAARSSQEKGTADLHSLMGVRFASLSETDRGARLDESLVKSVTGGDMVSSRALYQNFVSWKPQFTLWMATNHLPAMSADDDAIWRRVKPIHFPNSFTTGEREREMNLSGKILASERAGVLNWILDGVRAYLEQGFDQPAVVTEQAKAYQVESDPVNTFLVEATDEGRIEQGPEFSIKSSELYRAYTAWCQNNCLRPMSDRLFGRRLSDLGFRAVKGTGGVRMRSGVRLNAAFGLVSAQNPASERRW
jgi:putative DNA primase/helicase